MENMQVVSSHERYDELRVSGCFFSRLCAACTVHFQWQYMLSLIGRLVTQDIKKKLQKIHTYLLLGMLTYRNILSYFHRYNGDQPFGSPDYHGDVEASNYVGSTKRQTGNGNVTRV